MFPISDVIPSRKRPVVTLTLIAVNTLVYLYQLRLDEEALRRLVLDYGVIPTSWSLLDAVTSMFMHADLLHFAGNMVFLWIFGDNVEDRFGHLPYAGFYLAAGIAGVLAQTAADPLSRVPMIGASGAIAGVMGAYFLLYPRSRILTAVFVIVFMDIIEIPAIFFLGVWFLLQVAHGAISSTSAVQGGVAFWAHAAGFAVGIVTGTWLRTRGDGAYWRRAS